MAEGHRMTAADLVDKLLTSEHADVLRESVAWLVGELMEAEVGGLTGAELGERAPDRRQTQRNGYRQRRWDTRVGKLELAIPKLRTGSYFPSFLELRRRAEQALVAVVQEAYSNGISTRKVDRLVEQLGLRGMTKDTVSRLCRGLDEQVSVFCERPLAGAYPYLWLDAKVERVREPGGVRHKALVIAYGVHESGRREVIGLDVGEAETEAFWRGFLRSLRARGLDGVQLVISDAHTGLKTAIAKVFGCRWQRCTVHLTARHARPCRPDPAATGVGRDPRHLHSRLGRRGARASGPGRRPAPPACAQGRPAVGGRRGRPAGLLRLPGRALVQAAQHQPPGTGQCTQPRIALVRRR
jgi:transposase-like protein